jgi:hypothetical protein
MADVRRLEECMVLLGGYKSSPAGASGKYSTLAIYISGYLLVKETREVQCARESAYIEKCLGFNFR